MMHRSSSYPWTYFESLLGGHRLRKLFRDVHLYAMFIGHPRSGSTLVSSLLNAHRHIWAAQELNALRFVSRGYRRNQLFWLLYKKDAAFGRRGRKWTGYDYEVPNQWQGRFDRLLVMADKKAGVSTDMLARNPALLQRLRRTVQVPVRIVHLLRNPFNVITSMHLREKRTSLESAVQCFFHRCEVNQELMRQYGDDVHTIRLEDLIESPRDQLRTLCEFLGLEAEDSYLHDCSRILFDKPRQSHLQIQWTPELVAAVHAGIKRHPFLRRYESCGDLTGAGREAA